MLQKSVAVPLLAPELGEDAVRGPVSLTGVWPRDAARIARLFMRGACQGGIKSLTSWEIVHSSNISLETARSKCDIFRGSCAICDI